MLFFPIVKLGFAYRIERGISSAHPQLLLHHLPLSPMLIPQPPLSLLNHDVVPRLRLVLRAHGLALVTRWLELLLRWLPQHKAKPLQRTLVLRRLPLYMVLLLQGPLGFLPLTTIQVVLLSKDRLDTATALPPRRQYLTRSKVGASAFGISGLFGKIGPSNSSSSADSRIQGGIVSTPSSSLWYIMILQNGGQGLYPCVYLGFLVWYSGVAFEGMFFYWCSHSSACCCVVLYC
jgi:hypothetical protein